MIKVLILLSLFFTMSCVRQQIEQNPDIIFNAIKKNPLEFLNTLQEVQKRAMEESRKKQMDGMLKGKRHEVKIDVNRILVGPKDAPITIVEYSDFECPYCAKGYAVMKRVLKEYEGKVRFVYKHLPLDFHPLAEPASRYFEAIFKQDKKKALRFHDILFENLDKLRSKKEKYLKSLAKKVGADQVQLRKDLKSSKIKNLIKKDIAEARSFGISGTPGFLINGIAVKGAYPFETFKKIIDQLLKEEG